MPMLSLTNTHRIHRTMGLCQTAMLTFQLLAGSGAAVNNAAAKALGLPKLEPFISWISDEILCPI